MIWIEPQTFYQAVFNWAFNSYGAPDFLQINSSPSKEGELIGALQDRRYSLAPEKVIGFECTIKVENVDTTAAGVEKAGGEILMPKTEIPHVGWVIKFKDTEGNILCAMQYHDPILVAMKS